MQLTRTTYLFLVARDAGPVGIYFHQGFAGLSFVILIGCIRSHNHVTRVCCTSISKVVSILYRVKFLECENPCSISADRVQVWLMRTKRFSIRGRFYPQPLTKGGGGDVKILLDDDGIMPDRLQLEIQNDNHTYLEPIPVPPRNTNNSKSYLEPWVDPKNVVNDLP